MLNQLFLTLFFSGRLMFKVRPLHVAYDLNVFGENDFDSVFCCSDVTEVVQGFLHV